MPAAVAQGVLVTVSGIGVVLVVLGVLTAATVLLGRLFPAQRQAEETGRRAVAEGDKEREIAAAIAVALSLAQRPPHSPAIPSPAPGRLTPWVAYGRESLMSRRERLQGRWPKALIGRIKTFVVE